MLESFKNQSTYLQLYLNFYSAEINKSIFLSNLTDLLKRSKNRSKLIEPFGDFPSNSELCKLPEYSQFLLDNRKYLIEASLAYKQVLASIKGNCLILQGGLKVDDIICKAADNQMYLAEYTGRNKPKFFPLENAE